MDSLKHGDKKIILSGMSLEELEDLMTRMGESKFRARQLHNWIYSKSVSSVDEMTNLSKKFREALSEIAVITDVKISQRLISSDGTVKYLVEYPDGNCVETVLMRFDNRANLTACISSQVGCAVGCKFCATGKRGFIRNLTVKEIIEQILTIQRDTGLKITNVVYMGQGEPLLNFENVVSSIDFLNKEFEIGIRRITVSTSGIVPKIYELAKLNRQLTLALSLHAPEHELRKKLMPIESIYHLDELIKSLRYLTEQTGRRVTIEYTVIDHVNDSIEHAKEVNKLLKGLNCNINLIPYNPVENDEFRKPDINRINKFKYILEQSGKKVTVRLERGADIMAACGQLSGQKKNIEIKSIGVFRVEKSILEKNLEQIARYDAALAKSIASIKEYTHNLELRETTCGDLNLVVDGHPLHDEVDAVYEAEQIVAKTKYRDEKDTIHIIFGLGMGHLLQAFCKNSKGKIILYEPDIGILRAALEFVDLSSELSKSTVMLIDKEEKFEIAMGRLFFLKGEMTLSFLTSYVQLYPSVVSELKKKLVMLGSIYTNAYKELQRQSANWTVSVLNNLFRIYKNEELEALLGKFKDKPAVIVSAGPSLTENVEYIKQYRDNVVVFCVGTALKTLLKNGVRPDFVAMIESRYCLTQILDVDLSGINFIFYPSIFKGVYECDLDRVFNYYPDNMITTEWLENLSGIKADKYKSRGTVSICALESAYLLGCNPIILTGQDLAYRNGQCYASNSAYNIKYREVSTGKFELFVDDYDKYFGAAKLKDKDESMKKIQETLEENSKNLCFVVGQNGDKLLTSPAYAMFVEHFENIALEIAPYAKLFNTKSGGAQINGFENIKMQDFLEEYAAEKIDVEKIIDSSLRDYVSPKEFAKFKTTANTLLVSFEKCLNLFDKGEGEFKKLKNSYQRAKILTGEIRDRIGKISDIYSDIIREYVAKDRIFFSLLIREYYMMNEFLKEPNDYTDKEKMDELLDILQDFFSSGRQWLGLGIDFLKKQKELFDESSSSACK